MRVRDLIDLLGNFDPEATVAVAYQPNYPIWADVGTVSQDDGQVFVVAAEYGNNGYATRNLWDGEEV